MVPRIHMFDGSLLSTTKMHDDACHIMTERKSERPTDRPTDWLYESCQHQWLMNCFTGRGVLDLDKLMWLLMLHWGNVKVNYQHEATDDAVTNWTRLTLLLAVWIWMYSKLTFASDTAVTHMEGEHRRCHRFGAFERIKKSIIFQFIDDVQLFASSFVVSSASSSLSRLPIYSYISMHWEIS